MLNKILQKQAAQQKNSTGGLITTEQSGDKQLLNIPQTALSRRQSESNVSVMSDIDQVEIHDFQAKDQRIAEQYVVMNLFSKKDDNGEYTQVPFNISEDKIGKISIGLQQYLATLRYLAILFFIMFLISVPALYSNITGGGLTENQKEIFPLGLTTIANQQKVGLLKVDKTLSEEEQEAIVAKNKLIIEKFEDELEQELYKVTLPDFFYSLLFMIGIELIRRATKKIYEDNKRDHYYVSDYALKISNIPETITDEKIILQHFAQFGLVLEAKLARNYFSTMFYYNQLANLEWEQKLCEHKLRLDSKYDASKIQKLHVKIEKLKEKISTQKNLTMAQYQDYNDLPCLYAYILFDSQEEKVKMVKQYQKYETHWFWRFLTCGLYNRKKWIPNEYKILSEHIPKIEHAMEPSDILWQNLDVTKKEKTKKKITSCCFTVLLMIVTFCIIFISSLFSSEDSSSEICPEYSLTYSEMSELDRSIEENQNLVNCYCEQNGFSSILNNSGIRDLCYDYLKDKIISIILSIISAFIILIVNYLLKILLKKLGESERTSSITHQTITQMRKLFRAFFINTALITLILNANIFDIIPAKYFSIWIPPLYDKVNDQKDNYPEDFYRIWYIIVGSKIMITMLIYIVSPTAVFTIFTRRIFAWLRKRKAKKTTLQVELNQALLPPQMDFSFKYALLLNIVFVSLFYSPGMPLLLLFATCSFIIMYFCDKYLALRYYSKPAQIHAQLNLTVMNYLPYAIIFHLCIAIWTYGPTLIFPVGSSWSISDSISKMASSATSQSLEDSYNIELFKDRLIKVFWLTALLLVYIFFAAIKQLFCLIGQLLCPSKSIKVEDVTEQQQKTYGDVIQKLKEQGLISYDIEKNSKYKNLIKTIKSFFTTVLMTNNQNGETSRRGSVFSNFNSQRNKKSQFKANNDSDNKTP